MAINESWLPVISEALTWVREKTGPSKKELKIKVSDLEAQVKTLASGNAELLMNMTTIVQAILTQLATTEGCYINAETVILVGENKGSLGFTRNAISGDTVSRNIGNNQLANSESVSIFGNADEEIERARRALPGRR